MRHFTNLDAAESVFFTNELQYRKQRSYDILKAPLTAFELIPVSTEVDRAAETIAYEQYDSVGLARIIANYADDLPRADVKGKEFISRVRSVGDSYGWSLQEIRASMRAGKRLDQRKADAALRAQRELWNRIAFYGDAINGLPGLLTNMSIPEADASTGVGGKKWVNKTGQEILNDLNSLANANWILTKGVERPNTIVLPPDEYTVASTRAWQAGGTDTTILEFFRKQNPHITEVRNCVEFSAAELAANGVTRFNGGVAMSYYKSPEKLELAMPQMFEELPVQERNLEFVVPCHSRIGGVVVYYPFSIRFMDAFTSDAT